MKVAEVIGQASAPFWLLSEMPKPGCSFQLALAAAASSSMAARLSALLGWLQEEDVQRVEQVLLAAGLPIRGPSLGAERYLELMRHDKKVQDGRLRLVLLQSVGRAVVSDAASEAQILAAVESCCA